ncbi:MAG: dual specificity protein phosphatase family protein [Rhodospirillales bacterium]|nr:dual specificity protein phosphatase family protein [Rhodospirillales bacterium]
MAFEAPVHPRPAMSLIVDGLPPHGAGLYIGDSEAARDEAMLRDHRITTVVNCAVNLDINYVRDPAQVQTETKCATGYGPVRYYKLGLVDGDGNPETMMLAGYFMLDGAARQQLPERPTYPRRERGNILVHCRGGRSRSVALVALYMHMQLTDRFPTIDAAIEHIRTYRELQPDEWFETPKPMLLEAARRAARWARLIEADAVTLGKE